MALYINGNKASSGTDIIHLTQAQYDALPSSKNYNDKVYMITDVNGDGSQFQPVIYSEDEREIGVWVDGKPLYQRTFILIGSYSGDIEDLDIGINNTAEIKYSFGYMESDQNEHFPLTFANKNINSNACAYFFDSDNDIYLKFGLTAIEVAITIQYTKTTDQAGSGTWTPQGVPAVHYSTDEKVVGTWIDGSTIYQKTIYSSTLQVNYDNIINHNISNFNNCINIFGICKYNQLNEMLLLPYVSSNSIYNISLGNVTSTTFQISVGSGFSSIENSYITIQYTKSSQGGN